ncbi:ankyrin repeat domain-containing protein [Jejuia pallidilutea]|uniref:Ankyrin repeat domain protein n=2 Tax=Jejuia pallidilutea TaxID=504487 RepID=A0A090VQT1_9FLAO|nr:ankyrin repeat domain-containing protein [Jejuia pallidilutea]GAL65684.1 ankyrin repeat domain protein [Jejuia pallidilutea]GAL72418.1 ankyrin repeat domain protein [Jejuia pallidilutea]
MKTLKINSIKTVLLFCLSLVCFATSCVNQNKDVSSKSDITSKIEVPKQNIHEAIISNNFEALKQHIKTGRDINKKEPMGGSTPIITAITFNKPEMVKALLKANVDLSIKNNDGSTALHTAAFFGKVKMVQMLIDANADTTIKNNYGATPREVVLGDFSQIKPVYEMMMMQLEPMGFELDLTEVEKARPVIAIMLQ